MSQKLKKIEELDFFLRQSEHQLLLMKFSAAWCEPCQQLQKEITKLKRENKNLLVLEVDIEKFPALAQRPEFSVSSVPTLFLFDKQKIKKTHRGYLNLEQLKNFIKI